MKYTQILVALSVLCLSVVVPLVSSSSLSQLDNGAVVVSNEDLRENRLRNLAETIAELKAEADQENDQDDDTHMHQHRNLVQLHHSTYESDDSDDSSDSDKPKQDEPAPAPKKEEPKDSDDEDKDTPPSTRGDSPKPTDRQTTAPPTPAPATPKPRKHRTRRGKRSRKGRKSRNQGTRRSDLVALYRFESKKHPGRGLGGPGRNLKVYGKGIKVLTGKGVAKRGRGALFIPARSTAVPKTVNPKNPYANSFLARNSKGKPLKGLPKGDDSFTVAAWFKVSSSKPGRFGLVSFGAPSANQANVLKVTSTGQAISSFKNGNSLKSNNTNDSQPRWHHAAVTWNKKKKTQKIYLDGKLAAKRVLSQAPAIASLDGQFFLGLTANGPESEQFSGLLDDVAIFRKALSRKQIRRVKKGRFYPYLDLFALRKCSTRIGRRNHGAGFVSGSAKDQIALNSTTQGQYGFAVKNAYECSVKCAQTSDCRQAVFYVDASKSAPAPALPASATNAQKARAAAKARKNTAGTCYLQNKKYATYEADKSATSTTCRRPSKRLRRRSAVLKYSPAGKAAHKARKAARRKAREAKAAAAKAAKETKAKTPEEVKKAAEAKATEEKKAAATAATTAAAAKKVEEARVAAEKQALRNKQVLSEKREAKEKAITEAKNAVKEELKAKYAKKLAKLKDALDAKESALRQAKAQATHRELVQTKKAERVIAKLSKRLAKLTKKLAKKRDETRTLALAQKIKLAADKKAAEIVKSAKKRAASVKAKAKAEHRRRLRRKIAHKKRQAKRAARRAKKFSKLAKKLKDKRKKKQGKLDDDKRRAKKKARKAKKAAKRKARKAAKRALKRAQRRAARKAKEAKMTPAERKAAKAARKAKKAARKAKRAARKAKKRAAKKAAKKANKKAKKIARAAKEAKKKAKAKREAKKAAAAAKPKVTAGSNGGLKF